MGLTCNTVNNVHCNCCVRPVQCAQDKINAFWEISKKEIDDRRADLRNKDREMEEMEERHQVHWTGLGCDASRAHCHADQGPLLRTAGVSGDTSLCWCTAMRSCISNTCALTGGDQGVQAKGEAPVV